MQKERSKRLRKIVRSCSFLKIKQKIKKAKKYRTAIKASEINKLLKCCPNFIGCYAENELKELTLKKSPCFLIVNVDSSELDGSHWIALGLFQDRLEVIDPLGFTIFNWTRVPCGLMNFCHRFGAHRKIIVSKRVQHKDSTLCGFFCIYYVIHRQLFTLHRIMQIFCSDLTKNDIHLIQQFS